MKTPDELTERFRDRGLKVTPQRQAIFRALHGNDAHPTCRVRVRRGRPSEMPTISLRTVYQTLNDLADDGRARCTSTLGTGSARFDPNVETRTTTWSATGAGGSATCTPTSPVRPVPDGAAPRGSGSSGTEIVFRGRCERCRDGLTASNRSNQFQQPPRKGITMPSLKGSKTEENLKEAFAGESQANRRYLYFAQKADVEGYPDVAALFRSVAEGETGHAFGHFDFLAEVGDPATGEPVGPTEDNLKSAIAGETYEYTEMYPGFAKTARDEGFDEIAEWLETLARAEKSHAGRFAQGLESVS